MDISLSFSLLTDLLTFLKKLGHSKNQKKEHVSLMLDKITFAVNQTESFFYKEGNRLIQHNDIIAEAWRQAGLVMEKYFPDELLGPWLLHKSEAWANPLTWDTETLEKNGMRLKDIEREIERIRNAYL